MAGMARFERRYGLYVVAMAALLGLLWAFGFDLEAFLIAARDVAAGSSAYAGALAVGPEHWGVLQVYVSPPFLAHVLAPFVGLPTVVIGIGWSALGLLALGAAIRVLPDETLARRMPRFVFMLGYLWIRR